MATEAPIPTTPDTRKARTVFKQANITVVADGLQTSIVDASLFQDLGTPKNVLKIAPLSLLEFDKFGFLVEIDSRRAVAMDNSLELSPTSPISTMMEKYLRELKNVSVAAIGFNYLFEIVFGTAVVEAISPRFLRMESFVDLGKRVRSAGFKVISEEEDHLVQLTFDPLWNNPFAVSVLINYHHETPAPDVVAGVTARFSKYAAHAPGLVERMLNA